MATSFGDVGRVVIVAPSFEDVSRVVVVAADPPDPNLVCVVLLCCFVVRPIKRIKKDVIHEY